MRLYVYVCAFTYVCMQACSVMIIVIPGNNVGVHVYLQAHWNELWKCGNHVFPVLRRELVQKLQPLVCNTRVLVWRTDASDRQQALLEIGICVDSYIQCVSGEGRGHARRYVCVLMMPLCHLDASHIHISFWYICLIQKSIVPMQSDCWYHWSAPKMDKNMATCCCQTLNAKEFPTANFNESPMKIDFFLRVRGSESGGLHPCYWWTSWMHAQRRRVDVPTLGQAVGANYVLPHCF